MSQPTPTPLEYAATPLRREIGLGGAVLLGLGAILGSGVFVGLPIATTIAGPWVLLAILLAGGLAYCNAMSSAQLAAAHPVAGGTYEYGYRLLSPAWGFTAGWTFLLAKSASAATAALAVAETIASRVSLIEDRSPFASLAASAGAFVNSRPSLVIMVGLAALGMVVIAASIGLRRTSTLNGLLVTFTLIGLLAFAGLGVRYLLLIRGDVVAQQFWSALVDPKPAELSNLPLATALAFVAFTGYGRLATLGEEVTDPGRTIPRAVITTLSIAIVIYFVTSMLVWIVIYLPAPDENASASLVGCAWHFTHGWLSAPWTTAIRWLIAIAALTALLGVLLNLVLGLSRVWLAMGRRGDMPYILDRVNRRGVPVPATIVSGILIALLVLVGRDVRTTWSFSAFSVLIYYAITNLACMRLPAEQRRYPRSLAWIGLASCLSLAWFVDWTSIVVGTGLIAIGLLWHFMRRSEAREPQPV